MRRWPLLTLALTSAPATAGLTERQLAEAVARPPANARLPAALVFTDANGRRVTLGQVVGGRPLVLLFADYTCRHICGPALALTGGALADARLTLGRDVSLAVIGLDPKDSAADATHMADAQLGAEPAIRRSVALLRGAPATVAAAERALGYRAVYDPDTDQFAHDAVVYMFTPDGRLAALLPELALRPETLRAALSAPAATTESWASRAAHLCYGFAAAHGRFGRPIVLVLQALAALGLVAAAMLAFRRRTA